MLHRITSIVQLSATVKEFRIQRLDGAALADWPPGSHIALRFASAGGESFERSYSLIGKPGATDTYRIAVQREAGGTGGSRCLHDEIGSGSEILVDGPFDGFPLNTRLAAAPARALLIAGGIGITPMISMAHAFNRQNIPCTLHYLVHGADRLILLDELRDLPHVALHCHDSQQAGRAELSDLIDSYRAGSSLYACGPASLLQAIADTAARQGWPGKAVTFESFGARAQPGDGTLTVELALSGMTLALAPGTSILDALIAAEVFVSYDCRRGECGQCYATVLEGQPLHRDVCLSAEQRAAGMCTCVSWAAEPGRLLLDI